MKLRPMEPRDDAAVARLVRVNLKAHGLDVPGTVYFDPEVDHLSDFYLNRSGRGYFVLEDETGRVVGGVGVAEYEPRENCAELQKLYLDDAVKGRGLGYVLVDKAVEYARSLGYGELYIETHHNLQAATHLYEKRGFVRFAQDRAQMVHGAMDTFFIKEL